MVEVETTETSEEETLVLEPEAAWLSFVKNQVCVHCLPLDIIIPFFDVTADYKILIPLFIEFFPVFDVETRYVTVRDFIPVLSVKPLKVNVYNTVPVLSVKPLKVNVYNTVPVVKTVVTSHSNKALFPKIEIEAKVKKEKKYKIKKRKKNNDKNLG